jgi:hypothetical protein
MRHSLPWFCAFGVVLGACAAPAASTTELDNARTTLASGRQRDAAEAAATLAASYERLCRGGQPRACREAISFYWHGVKVHDSDTLTRRSLGTEKRGTDLTRAKALFETLLALEWQGAEHANTIDAYRRVVDEFPRTAVAARGNAKLDELLVSQAQREFATKREPSVYVDVGDSRPGARARLVPLVQAAGLSGRSVPFLIRVQAMFAAEGEPGRMLAAEARVAEEEEAWKALLSNRSIGGFQEHQTKFGDGPHSAEARANEAALAYAEALAVRGTVALERYLTGYPSAASTSEARAEIERRRKAGQDEADDQRWTETDRQSCAKGPEEDACSSVESYLKAFERGRHAAEARALINRRRAAGAAAAASAKAFCVRARAGVTQYKSVEKFCKAGGEGDYASCVSRSRGCL